MPEIKTVLTTVAYSEEQFEVLRKALEPARVIHCSTRDNETINEALKTADVAILGSDLDDRFLHAPNLKWIHCDHAGLNKSAKPEIFRQGIFLTSSAGRSAPALAEHAMFFMLSLAFHFIDFYKAQEKHQWGVEGQDSFRALYGKTLGIFGMGNTGRNLAKRAKAFEMKVLGYSRDHQELPEGFDRQFITEDGENFEALLRESDFIVLALPLCDETYHMISTREFEMMKSGVFLVNMARGAIIDEKALVKALYEGRIAGAGLDTFEQEPLPRESMLWDAPHTLIMPHTTPQVPTRTERSLEIICENIHRYRAEIPMLNILTKQDIYTKGVL